MLSFVLVSVVLGLVPYTLGKSLPRPHLQLCMTAGKVKLAQPLQEISEQHLVKLKKESECILVSEILFLDINI